MDAEAWIALASLAFVILCQTAVIAFVLGGLFARVRAIEARPETNCEVEMARLNGTMTQMDKNFSGRVESLERSVRNLMMAKSAQ